MTTAPDGLQPDIDDLAKDQNGEYSSTAYDELIGAELHVPKGSDFVKAQVVKRARGEDGNPIGIRNPNPLLDTREYDVLFPDGSTESYSTNVIAENLYSQVDSEGRQFYILKEIVEHKSDASAISKDDVTIRSHNGNLHPKMTTRGWQLLVEWKDGSQPAFP